MGVGENVAHKLINSDYLSPFNSISPTPLDQSFLAGKTAFSVSVVGLFMQSEKVMGFRKIAKSSNFFFLTIDLLNIRRN